MIDKLKNNININSKILSKSTIEDLKNKVSEINMYHGNLKDSDIVFFRKSN